MFDAVKTEVGLPKPYIKCDAMVSSLGRKSCSQMIMGKSNLHKVKVVPCKLLKTFTM